MAEVLGLGRDARFYEELGTKEDVQRLLDSQFVQEKLQGIKSVMAMAALGRDIGKPQPQPLAPDLLATPLLRVRKQIVHPHAKPSPSLNSSPQPTSVS